MGSADKDIQSPMNSGDMIHRILHLRASNFYGGPERQIHAHAKLSQLTPYRVTVGSFCESGVSPELLRVLAADNIPTLTIELQGAYDWAAVQKLRRALRDGQFEILCTHDYRSHIVGVLATAGTGIKWIPFCRGWTRENMRVRFFQALARIAMIGADHVVFISGKDKSAWHRLFHASGNLSVVPNCVTLSPNEIISIVDLRARYEFPAESPVLISAGRFSPEKGQQVFVESAALALVTNPDLRFVLFGDGPTLASIRELIARKGLAEQIVCPGFEANMYGCLLGADALVNPSLSEASPNIVLEAISLGVPVVATDVGSVREILTGERDNHVLVEPENAAALAKGIAEIVGRESVRMNREMSGTPRIPDELSPELQTRRLVDVYRTTLGIDSAGGAV